MSYYVKFTTRSSASNSTIPRDSEHYLYRHVDNPDQYFIFAWYTEPGVQAGNTVLATFDTGRQAVDAAADALRQIGGGYHLSDVVEIPQEFPQGAQLTVIVRNWQGVDYHVVQRGTDEEPFESDVFVDWDNSTVYPYFSTSSRATAERIAAHLRGKVDALFAVRLAIPRRAGQLMYTSSDLCQLTGLSRQRLSELRQQGRLREGVDYHWNRGRVEYTESALQLIRSLPGAGRPPTKTLL